MDYGSFYHIYNFVRFFFNLSRLFSNLLPPICFFAYIHSFFQDLHDFPHFTFLLGSILLLYTLNFLLICLLLIYYILLKPPFSLYEDIRLLKFYRLEDSSGITLEPCQHTANIDFLLGGSQKYYQKNPPNIAL